MSLATAALIAQVFKLWVWEPPVDHDPIFGASWHWQGSLGFVYKSKLLFGGGGTAAQTIIDTSIGIFKSSINF